MTTAPQRRISLLFGWGFAVLGLLGLAVPLFPSVPLLVFALVFLAKAKPRFRHLRMALKRRFPSFLRAFGEAELRAAQIARGQFIASIRAEYRGGQERRRVGRLMRRRRHAALREGISVAVDDALAYVGSKPAEGAAGPSR